MIVVPPRQGMLGLDMEERKEGQTRVGLGGRPK